MLAATLTRKTLQAICLSVWLCCLPTLKAGIDCTECAESCSSAACCQMACTSGGSGAVGGLSAISLSRSNHGAVPPGEPCSCSCCVLQFDMVATQNSSPRGRSELPSDEQESTSVYELSCESAPPSRFASYDRRRSVRSLERCIRLCRFNL